VSDRFIRNSGKPYGVVLLTITDAGWQSSKGLSGASHRSARINWADSRRLVARPTSQPGTRANS